MASQNGQNKTKQWTLFVIATVCLFFFVSVSSIKETYREWKFDQELVRMQKEIEQLEGKKLELVELLNRLDSKEALDKEARTRLGLKQPGERVIVLEGFTGATTTWKDSTTMTTTATSPLTTKTNAQQWFDYFFAL